jgi:hypothetical protein
VSPREPGSAPRLPLVDATPSPAGPPRRSKVAAVLAGGACAACCVLPLLVSAGLLTGASAVVARNSLPAASVLLALAAGVFWLAHNRRSRRPPADACGEGTCSC